MSSTTDSVTQPEGTNASERFTGRVKWFNNKAGYGFISITDGAQAGTDVFVHHSAIGVSSEQYKYLVQGEYVQFALSTTQTGNHTVQASGVSGINGGKLMCETRNEYKNSRKSYKTTSSTIEESTTVSEPVKKVRRQPEPKTARTRGEGPRDAEKGAWKVVGEKTSTNVGTTKPRGKGRPPRSVEESQ
jgi:CspA family cold shock protein